MKKTNIKKTYVVATALLVGALLFRAFYIYDTAPDSAYFNTSFDASNKGASAQQEFNVRNEKCYRLSLGFNFSADLRDKLGSFLGQSGGAELYNTKNSPPAKIVTLNKADQLKAYQLYKEGRLAVKYEVAPGSEVIPVFVTFERLTSKGHEVLANERIESIGVSTYAENFMDRELKILCLEPGKYKVTVINLERHLVPVGANGFVALGYTNRNKGN